MPIGLPQFQKIISFNYKLCFLPFHKTPPWLFGRNKTLALKSLIFLDVSGCSRRFCFFFTGSSENLQCEFSMGKFFPFNGLTLGWQLTEAFIHSYKIYLHWSPRHKMKWTQKLSQSHYTIIIIHLMPNTQRLNFWHHCRNILKASKDHFRFDLLVIYLCGWIRRNWHCFESKWLNTLI